MRVIFTALSIVLLFVGKSWAQDPVLRHFTLKDGFPGGRVYHCMQDSKGYLWSATDRGVTRFDGHQFKLFSIKDGLPCNDVWDLQEDSRGRIWLSTFSNVCYIEEEQVVVLDSLSSTLNKGKVIHHFCPLGHFVVFSDERLVYVLDEENNIVSTIKPKDYIFLSKGVFFGEEKMPYLFSASKDGKKKSGNARLILANQTLLLDEDQKIDEFFQQHYHALKQLTSISAQKAWALISGQLWELSDNKLVPLDLSSLFTAVERVRIEIFDKIAENRIWIKSKVHNVVVDTLLQPVWNLDFLDHYAVNNIYFDRQDNLWLSSGQGLFFLNKEGQNSHTYLLPKGGEKDRVEHFVLNAEKKLWGISNEGYLYQFNDSLGFKKISANTLVNTPMDLIFDQQGNLFVAGDELVKIDHQVLKKLSTHSTTPLAFPRTKIMNHIATKYLQINAEGKLLSAMSNQIYTMAPESIVPERVDDSERYYSLAAKKNGDYWAAGKNGLDLFHADNTKSAFRDSNQIALLKRPIDNILLDAKEELWVAVNNRGLFHLAGNRLDTISELEGILVSALSFDATGRLWIATNQGVAKVFDIEYQPFSYQLNWLTEVDGLASNDVKKVLSYDNKIFASTEKGFSILPDLEKENIERTVAFRFSNFKVNGENRKIQDHYELNYHEHNILIEYECLDFKNMESMSFQYKLDGIDPHWIETKAFNKEYALLAPGKYTFRIRRKTDQRVKHAQEIILSFSISPPLWERPWFLLSLLLLLSFAGKFFLEKQKELVRKKAKEENQIKLQFAEIELSALQAQLNPHFISNALQAIQSLMLKNNERATNRYLVKFSRLMRLMLESSKAKYITLQDELQLLKLYVELEQLRFQNQFTHTVKIDEVLARSTTKIPTMLLQPFVENAINHGLNHRKTPGKLCLSITKKEEYLHFSIEDNGIGRTQAIALQKASIKSYKSRGIQLVKERQKAWNALGNAPIKIEIEDLYDRDGNARGTKVNVIISIKK